MTQHFQKELERLRKRLLSLSAMVEDGVLKSVEAFQKRDVTLAESVLKSDDNIDRTEIEIEEDCLKILALHQPVASDLRFIIAVLKMNNDLERIGDQAVKIAYKAIDLAALGEPPIYIDFDPLVEKTRQMLDDALDALINQDTVLAEKVRTSDDVANDMKEDIRKEVIDAIKKYPEKAEILIMFLGVARSLERISDLTTNIAEDVIYMIEGDIVRHGYIED